MQRRRICFALGSFCISLGLMSGEPGASTVPWSESILASFPSEATGEVPVGTLVADGTGALYGMTQSGGPFSTCDNGCGTIFKLTPPASGKTVWSRSVLYAFEGSSSSGPSDGAEPVAGPIADARGALYGTTSQGGINTPNGQGGVVFELTPPAAAGMAWNEHVLYAFSGRDGLFPSAALVTDARGALYGTTEAGGAFDNFMSSSGYGTAFKLTPPAAGATSWSETVLYSFSGGADGSQPLGSLIGDARGNLYGTTFGGGTGAGTVFKLTPPAAGSAVWNESVLYSFTGRADGGFPQGNVIADARGALYGTTGGGGAHGAGVVFRLNPPATGATAWTETVLYAFRGGSDGANSPNSTPQAGLFANASGTLYGTTEQGGNPGCAAAAGHGCGTVFRLAPPRGASAWSETVLHAFAGGADGYFPNGVLAYGRGTLYGTTCCGGGTNSNGSVFQLSEPMPALLKRSR